MCHPNLGIQPEAVLLELPRVDAPGHGRAVGTSPSTRPCFTFPLVRS